MSNLINAMQNNSTILNTKGGQYYATSYDSNLDFFSGVSRNNNENDIKRKFANAYSEDSELALANLLNTLDIRNGKGERRIFKICYEWLCNHNADDAIRVMPFIAELGRWDYLLVALDTQVGYQAINTISKQLKIDLESENPSLLAKWMPSVRTHGKNNPQAHYIATMLGLSDKDYRKMLSALRSKINIVEKNLTEGNYEGIDFEQVPTKAMLKYRNTFETKMPRSYKNFLDGLATGKKKVNTTGLFCYEIIRKLRHSYTSEFDEQLFDAMWNNQKDFLEGNNANVLVMADTSGSMTNTGPNWNDDTPFCASVGLALYIAERNHGFFHDYYMTFSNRPLLQKVTGATITDKYANVKKIIQDTNIDFAFEMLLDAAVENNIPQEEMPSHIIICSDMEFDEGVYSENGTNFQGWKKAFEKQGYKLPTIIFWNVANETDGLPVTKNDQDVCMISGFSTAVLQSILDIENYSPVNAMLEVLKPYIKMLA